MSAIVLGMRTKDTSLANMLFGQPKVGSSRTLYGRTDAAFFIRQNARQIEVTVGAAHCELMTLADAGLADWE